MPYRYRNYKECGKRANMSNAKRAKLQDTGRGTVGKTAVLGMKDMETNEITASVVGDTTASTLQGFVADHADRRGKGLHGWCNRL